MTPEQLKRRKQMLDAHLEEHSKDTHDYRSPKEWQRQIFWLEIKKTLFHLVLNVLVAASVVAGLYLLWKNK